MSEDRETMARRVLAPAIMALIVVHAALALYLIGLAYLEATDFVLADGVTPLGGDFLNLFTVGRMVLENRFAEIYDPAAFDAFQRALVGQATGFRLWAYPPQSLFLAVPFALPDYRVSLLVFSIVGLLVLGWGAARAGFTRFETLALLASPASVLCVYYGQTGNLACGLLLAALSARRGTDLPAVLATSILTIKPQMGFLLPIHWLIAHRYALFAAVSVAVLALMGLAFFVFGLAPFESYLTVTLPLLDRFERIGTGPFMAMIPSIFMSTRILTGNGELAALVHAVLFFPILALIAWGLFRKRTGTRAVALVLAGTAMLTPYLHVYDLTLVLAAAMLIANLRGGALSWLALALAWALPYATLLLNARGLPVSPLILAFVLYLALAPSRASA